MYKQLLKDEMMLVHHVFQQFVSSSSDAWSESANQSDWLLSPDSLCLWSFAWSWSCSGCCQVWIHLFPAQRCWTGNSNMNFRKLILLILVFSLVSKSGWMDSASLFLSCILGLLWTFILSICRWYLHFVSSESTALECGIILSLC